MLKQFIADLPIFYRERFRVLSPGGEPAFKQLKTADNRFVLYWMATAQRLAENPALDMAWMLANALQQPCLIYQGVTQRYRWASDRHHTFLLQSARELQARSREYGLDYLLEVETGLGNRSTRLKDLAASASVIVVEDFPCAPQRDLRRALLRTTQTPIIAVDTACVVPPLLVARAHTRAFEYRDSTKRWYTTRVPATYPQEAKRPHRRFSVLPESTIDLSHVKLSEVVSACDIDHSVPPVSGTTGGSVAGYQRWQVFKESRLKPYAWRRNDATQDGTSRLSPYLHYGMVSPFRIARETNAVGGDGAEKYLDELLIWRELAYSYCFHTPHHDRWQALPDWARATLLAHANDQRPQLYSWDQLAHAETNDELWNAAQQSLLLNGELHNNLRMTWGKTVLQWTATPQIALKRIIDLNHRYALDGRDPSSYGGLLWCLGQFDRPFEPEAPVFGTVRPRSTVEHARRLDVLKFRKTWIMQRSEVLPRIAVVGAGMSGAIAAMTLARQGYEVAVFDKSRGAGGRMATRRWDNTTFDHGAQYFTVQNERFARYVDAWQEEELVALWPADIAVYEAGKRLDNSVHKRYVATPTMASLVKRLLDKAPGGLTQRYDTLIETLQQKPQGWELLTGSADDSPSLGMFDRVIVTLPAPQAALLNIQPAVDFASQDNNQYQLLKERLAAQPYDPTWALMVAFESALEVDWGGAFLNGKIVKWASRTNTKPGRAPHPDTLVLHAQSDFSIDHFEASKDDVAQQMLAEFWAITGLAPRVPLHNVAHRWRYAIPKAEKAPGLITDNRQQLIFCGDWSFGAKVEGAFLSGLAAAGLVMSNAVADNHTEN